MKGIDVASFQGVVPWHRLNDINFGIIKVTEGEGYTAPHWIDNAINLKVEKKERGFYCFSLPGFKNNTPEAEAAYFWSKIEPVILKGDLIACDIEVSYLPDITKTSEWAKRLLSHLEYLAGWKPLIYSYPDFITRNLTDTSLCNWPLWLAWREQQLPRSFAQWKTIALWQQGPGAVKGLQGQVDIDIFFLTAPQLESYGKP